MARDIEVIESIDVVGRRPGVDRRGDEVLESIDVTGRKRTGGNGPVDGELLESIDVRGKIRKKSDPKHLYYPEQLASADSNIKNAIRFKIYAQGRSYQDDPGNTPYIKEVPDQYLNNSRTFPVSTGGFIGAFAAKSSLFSGLGSKFKVNPGALFEDIVGIGANGVDYFFDGQLTQYGRRTQQLESTVTLYMPDTMVNQDKHDYQPISINEAAGRAGLYTAGMPAAVGGTGSPLGRVEVMAELAGRAGIFGTRATEAVLAGLGYALNPMLEMTYGGTQNRVFLFTFRFAPRNFKEAEEVLKIIKTFRFHSHSEPAGYEEDSVSRSSGSRYLIPPNHFEIEFLRKVNGRFEENLAMPRISTCMIAQVQTDYASQLDTFTTFRDGKPVSISLNLEFMESVILTKGDIKKGY